MFLFLSLSSFDFLIEIVSVNSSSVLFKVNFFSSNSVKDEAEEKKSSGKDGKKGGRGGRGGGGRGGGRKRFAKDENGSKYTYSKLRNFFHQIIIFVNSLHIANSFAT